MKLNSFFKRFPRVAAFREMLIPSKAQSLTTEIATRERSIDFFNMGWWLPNPDPILKAMGKDIQVYADLRADGYLSGLISSRKAATLKQEWGLDRGKSKSRQAAAIEKALRKLNMHRINSEMLDGAGYGYQPMEVLWDLQDGLWMPKDIVGKPQRWFVYDEKNQLKMRTKESWNGEHLPNYRFLVPRKDPSYENPYGLGDLSRCFWPITFKRNGFAFWAKFAEKFGMPFMVGKVPRGMDQKEYDKLRDMMQDMLQDAVAAIPSDGSIEILNQGSAAASADIYEKFIDNCKKEVSVVNLGHEGAAQSTPGKLGGEDAALQVLDNIVDADTKMLEAEWNQLIGWVWELNFGSGERPTFSMWKPEEVDQALATRDKDLAALGVKFKKSYFVENYNLAEEDFDLVEKKDPPPAPPGEPATFADARLRKLRPSPSTDDQDALDEALALLSPEQLQGFAEGMLKPVWDLVEKSAGHEEFSEALAKTYPDMDDATFEQRLAQAMFVTQLLGRMKAQAEAKGA